MRKSRKWRASMSSESAGAIRIEQPCTFLIRIDGLSTGRRQRCLVTFVDAETSTVVATRSFDSSFVAQASLRELMNIMKVAYHCRSHRVEQATRALHFTTRSVARLLSGGATREHRKKRNRMLRSKIQGLD